MKVRMRELARLGPGKGGYPRILADSRNWILQLGPDKRRELRYYTSWTTFVNGLVEHLMRRRLGDGTLIEGLHGIVRAHRKFLAEAKDLVERVAVIAGTYGDGMDSGGRNREIGRLSHLHPPLKPAGGNGDH